MWPHAKKHGGKGTRLYSTWVRMKQRCYNQNNEKYPRYGGRGITVCDEWRNDFAAFRDWAFANGYSNELTIDRIDNDGNYCPENCRWATIRQQNNNRSVTCYLTFNGETHVIADWNKKQGFGVGVIEQRLKRGWTVEKALTAPVKPIKRKQK